MERFALMADLSADQAEKYLPLCEDAAEEITRRSEQVQNGAAAQRVLCAAAAALVLYRWALFSASGDLGSFSAGDVKVVKSGANVVAAKQVWQEAAAAAAPYLKDDGFLFRRIQP